MSPSILLVTPVNQSGPWAAFCCILHIPVSAGANGVAAMQHPVHNLPTLFSLDFYNLLTRLHASDPPGPNG
jgi:hypothetical protein